jgi:hypothetical protein
MKLTIHNITNIVNTKINTTDAQWQIEYVMSNEEYYTIKCSFVYGKAFGKKHPKHVYFQLYREKHKDGYWVMDSTEKNLYKWGVWRSDLNSGYEFVANVLERQLDNL